MAGFLDVDDCCADPAERRYRLEGEARAALLDTSGVDYVAPLAGVATALARCLPQVQNAFRAGGGVAPHAYGHDLGDDMAVLNRPLYLRLLAGWLAAVPDVHDRLGADPPARVADIGCGLGWSSVALALAYPKVTVQGLDLDPRAVEGACENAARAGVVPRVRFFAGDVTAAGRGGDVTAAGLGGGGTVPRATGEATGAGRRGAATTPALAGPFDLVTCFEALHDMAQPVEALRGMRRLLADGGRVLIAEERVDTSFRAPGDSRNRAAYGWSVLYCLPTGRSQEPSAATGAVLRPSALAEYAAAAGFPSVTVVPVDDAVWRFYLLV